MKKELKVGVFLHTTKGRILSRLEHSLIFAPMGYLVAKLALWIAPAENAFGRIESVLIITAVLFTAFFGAALGNIVPGPLSLWLYQPSQKDIDSFKKSEKDRLSKAIQDWQNYIDDCREKLLSLENL